MSDLNRLKELAALFQPPKRTVAPNVSEDLLDRVLSKELPKDVRAALEMLSREDLKILFEVIKKS